MAPGSGGRSAGRALLLGEPRLHHVLRDRRGEVAVLGVLGEHDAGNGRILRRREEHEPAVVAQVAVAAGARALPWLEMTCAVPVLPPTS